MRYVVAMAAIPVAVWAAYPAPTPRLIPVKTVTTEGVRSVRQDSGTFRVRWSPVGDLAPTVVVQNISDDRTIFDVPSGTLIYKSTPTPVEVQPAPVRTRTRRASLRLDLCQRHGMHRVNYGRRWRCRR